MDKENNYKIVKFKDEDFSLDVYQNIDDLSVWLTQKQLADLYKVLIDNIGLHIKNIIKNKELDSSTTKESSVVQYSRNPR